MALYKKLLNAPDAHPRMQDVRKGVDYAFARASVRARRDTPEVYDNAMRTSAASLDAARATVLDFRADALLLLHGYTVTGKRRGRRV